jgi:thimet oligopeptidase
LVLISELGISYGKNVSEDKTKLFFSLEELKGLPESLIKSLKLEDEKYEITMSYPHIHGVL